jgi:hypothetical protein
MRIVNVPVRAILELPYPTPLGRRLMLLFVTGRQTGKTYRLPVSYVPDGDTLLTPGGGNWKLNLADGRPIRIRLRGEDRYATPEIIRAPADIEPLLEKVIKANRMAQRSARIRETQQRFYRARLEPAPNHGFAIVRWHLDRGQ